MGTVKHKNYTDNNGKEKEKILKTHRLKLAACCPAKVQSPQSGALICETRDTDPKCVASSQKMLVLVLLRPFLKVKN